jgi:SAM-dependent methyltransferase
VSDVPATSVTYAMGYTDEERQRLAQQAEVLRRFTKHMRKDAGIGKGMRVLDVGCGVGDVSMLAAAAVGSTGVVVAIDSDPGSLEIARARSAAAGFANIEFVDTELRTLELDGRFDAVVGRLILMHLPDPVAAVRRFARHVVPGGIVAFQEYQLDFPSALSFPAPLPLWEQAMEWIRATFRLAGVETGMGLKLQGVFTDAGLPMPEMRMDTHLINAADRLGPQVCAQVLRSILPLAERFGVASARDMAVDTFAERLHADVVSERSVLPWPPLVGAWSQITPDAEPVVLDR